MKRIILTLLCCLLTSCCAIAFSGCDKSAKTMALGITEAEYSAGEQIVQITDNYLDFKITKEQAKAQLKEIEDRLSGTSSTPALYCRSIVWDLTSLSKNDTDVLEDRNSLAEYLGLAKR